MTDVQDIRGPELSAALVTAIATELANGRPADWNSMEYRVRTLTSYLEDELNVVTVNDVAERSLAPRSTPTTARKLRDSMYREGAGTWFSAKIVVTSNGEIDADFDYDNEPNWDDPVSALWYASDLKKYPRSETARPLWLQQRLAEAAAVGDE